MPTLNGIRFEVVILRLVIATWLKPITNDIEGCPIGTDTGRRQQQGMPARRRYWRTERVPPILWRSSSRKMGRQDELSSDECSSPPRNYCTINQEMVKHGGFSFAPDGSESISVTPDNASTPTTDGTTTQYEIMDDDLLSEGIQRKNKAMFHMEHLKHELTRWITTIQKHRKIKKNKYRHRTIQRSLIMRRKSITPSRTPLRRKRSPQTRTNTCLSQ